MNWSNGNIFLQSGAAVTNNGTVDAQSDNGVFFNGGGAVSLVNNGLIKKTAGSGTTTIGNSIGFNNLGTVSVLSGTIALPNNFTNNGTLAGTGTFSVAGTLTNNGTIAAGNNGVGTLTETGNYIQSAIGAFNAQLGTGTNSDLFNINGTAGLNGALNLFCASCAVQAGDIFTILDSVGNLSGTFASMTSSGFLNGFSYNILYDYGLDRVQVQVVNAGINPMGGVPEPASWALMIIGFGLVGAAMRRRAKVQIVTA